MEVSDGVGPLWWNQNLSPIKDFGLIGDLHTAALVSKNGSIDWCCWPDFDSPAVFCKLLDAELGGSFRDLQFLVSG